MTDGAKNICDACAIGTAAFSFLFNNAPQIAAVLSVIWLMLRIIDWCVRVYKRGIGNGDDGQF